MSLRPVAVISALLCLLLAQTGNPQQIIEPPFIGLEFRCPTYVLAPQSITLLADVFGAKEVLGEDRAKLIAYRWEISEGKIIAGQGTPKVTIDASDLPPGNVRSIDIKIILDGGPPEFDKERTCSLKIDPRCSSPVVFDQYEGISLRDEEQRLDRLGKYLTSEGSGSSAFVVAYGGRKACRREAEWRANRARKYLMDTYKVEASRVIAVNGGFRDNLAIDLFTSSRTSCGPFPTPSLAGSSAYVNGSCADKYKEIASP